VSAAVARDTLARIEDDLASAGWPWNEAVSLLIDALVVFIENGS
jgi:hypothetical protein